MSRIGTAVLVALVTCAGCSVSRHGATVALKVSDRPTTRTASPAPDLIVAHLPTETGRPGAVVTIDRATGRHGPALATEYDPYLANGFAVSADRRSVYYTRLNEPAQRIEIVELALTGGGGPTVVGEGIDVSPSPDGRLLAFRSFRPDGAVFTVRVADGVTTSFPPSAANSEMVVDSLTWLADAHHVVALFKTPNTGAWSGPHCPACAANTTTTQPSPPPTAMMRDVTSPGSAWEVLAAPTGSTWADTKLLGSGRETNSFVATVRRSETTVVETIDVRGRVVDQTPIADGDPVAIDASGTNLLVATRSDLLWQRLSGGPAQSLGTGPVAQAAW